MSELSFNLKNEVLRLLERVPSPPEESLPAGASKTVLRDAEEANGIVFPPKLREWLLTSNGACVGPGGVVGIGTIRDSQDLTAIYRNYPMWQEKGWIPVAGDGFGSYYVVATANEFGAGEPVLFVDVNETPYEPAFIVGSNVWRFLSFLLSRELEESRWPFNEAEVTSKDPEILTFANVSLPWNA